MSIEYELQNDGMDLCNVLIIIPTGTEATPDISNVDGVHIFSARDQQITWSLDSIDSSNSTGSLEFTIQVSSLWKDDPKS